MRTIMEINAVLNTMLMMEGWHKKEAEKSDANYQHYRMRTETDKSEEAKKTAASFREANIYAYKRLRRVTHVIGQLDDRLVDTLVRDEAFYLPEDLVSLGIY